MTFDAAADFLPPPHSDLEVNMFAQAISEAGAKMVTVLASLDRKLQDAGILPELKRAQLPAEIADGSGELASDYAIVRTFNFTVIFCIPSQQHRFHSYTLGLI